MNKFFFSSHFVGVSPTQKAQVVSLIQKHTGKRACAVGDGGNDVSMIQQSDAGMKLSIVQPFQL